MSHYGTEGVDQRAEFAAARAARMKSSGFISTGDVMSVANATIGDDSESMFAANFAIAELDAEEYTSRDFASDLGNMFKAFIGMNFMYVSYAFSKAGMIRGCIGLIAILLLTEYCCMALIRVKRSLPPPTEKDFRWTYGDLGRAVFGVHAERIINVLLIFTQFGFCVGYLIFLSQTLRELFYNASAPASRYLLIPLPVLIPLGMLRSVRSLAPFSMLANLALLGGYVAIMIYIALNFEWRPSSPPLKTFPIFAGEMTSALEGIALVIPVESSMKDRTQFRSVLRMSLFLLLLVMLPMGIFGFATFGEDVNDFIINNITGSSIVDVLKLSLCVGILFTYPLQIAPVMHALDKILRGDFFRHVVVHDLGAADFEVQRRQALREKIALASRLAIDESEVGRALSLSEDSDLDSELSDAEVVTDMLGRPDSRPLLDTRSQRIQDSGAIEQNGERLRRAQSLSQELEAPGPLRVYRLRRYLSFDDPRELLRAAFEQADMDDISSLSWERLNDHEIRRRRRAKSAFVQDSVTITARCLVMLGTVAVAILAGDHFGIFMSLVGCLGASGLAYCLPAVLHCYRFWGESSLASKLTDFCVLLLGLTLAFTGTWISVLEFAS